MESNSQSVTFTCDNCQSHEEGTPGLPLGWFEAHVVQLSLHKPGKQIDLCPTCLSANDATTLGNIKALLTT